MISGYKYMTSDCSEVCVCTGSDGFLCSPKQCSNGETCITDDKTNEQLCSLEENCKILLIESYEYKVSFCFAITGQLILYLQLYYITITDMCATDMKVDLLFVLDSSESVTKSNFYSMLQLTKDIVRRFDIGPDAVQVEHYTSHLKKNDQNNFYRCFNNRLQLRDIMQIQNQFEVLMPIMIRIPFREISQTFLAI